jgi:hypothetical protein
MSWKIFHSEQGVQEILRKLAFPFGIILFWTFGAIKGGLWILASIGLLGTLALGFNIFRSLTARLIVTPEGAYVVNKWKSYWFQWSDIQTITIDTTSLAFAKNKINSNTDSTDSLFSQDPCLIIVEGEGPRILKGITIYDEDNVEYVVDAYSREALNTLVNSWQAGRENNGY